jgi:hypothetical protein
MRLQQRLAASIHIYLLKYIKPARFIFLLHKLKSFLSTGQVHGHGSKKRLKSIEMDVRQATFRFYCALRRLVNAGNRLVSRVLRCLPLRLGLRDAEQNQPVVGKYYVRTGSCNGCGVCCQNIYLVHQERPIASVAEFERLQHLFDDYAPFHPIEETEYGLVFRCGQLQADNTCGIYDSRPDFCRRYPTELSLVQGGKLADECSYVFTPRAAFPQVLASVAASRLPGQAKRPFGLTVRSKTQ